MELWIRNPPKSAVFVHAKFSMKNCRYHRVLSFKRLNTIAAPVYFIGLNSPSDEGKLSLVRHLSVEYVRFQKNEGNGCSELFLLIFAGNPHGDQQLRVTYCGRQTTSRSAIQSWVSAPALLLHLHRSLVSSSSFLLIRKNSFSLVR